MSELPNTECEVAGLPWSSAALILAGLMRKMGVNELTIDSTHTYEPKGMMIEKIGRGYIVTMQEKKDVDKGKTQEG